MKNYRNFYVALFAACLWWTMPSLSAAEDAAGKSHKLLILDSQKGNFNEEVRVALLQTLADLGFQEGKNLQVTLQVTENDVKEGERILGEELKKGYDVIFSGGTMATIAARNLLFGKEGPPVVFGSVTDPVGVGVIKDFTSKPLDKFTGVCYPVPVKTRLKFVRQFLPKAVTLGMIHADIPQSHSYRRWVQELLDSDPDFKDIKIIFRSVPLVTGADGDNKMVEAVRPLIQELDPLVDAFISPNDPIGTSRSFPKLVATTATKPLIGLTKKDVMEELGASAVVFPSHESIGQQSALMIKQILEGKKPADILPEWPKKFGFAVDMRKSKQFNIDVPMKILQLAGKDIIR